MSSIAFVVSFCRRATVVVISQNDLLVLITTQTVVHASELLYLDKFHLLVWTETYGDFSLTSLLVENLSCYNPGQNVSKYHQSYTSYYLQTIPKRFFFSPPSPHSMLVNAQFRSKFVSWPLDCRTNIEPGGGGWEKKSFWDRLEVIRCVWLMIFRHILSGIVAWQVFHKETCQGKTCHFFPSTRANKTRKGENLLAWTMLLLYPCSRRNATT